MAIDDCILALDRALRTLFTPATTLRAVPGADQPEAELDAAQRAHAAALMRVNHCGEICAQALYQGQAMVSREPAVTRALEQAAREETEHLAWTERRIAELGGRKSLLNPFWYGGSLAVGLLAGRFGSAWNLGFLAETERQVEAHLENYMARLPRSDRRSWLMLEKMRQDEASHAATARHLGGRELPEPVKQAMRFASRLMTASAYRV